MSRFLPSVRRRWSAVGAVAVWGLLAGVGYAALTPPLLASSALVVVSSTSAGNLATQAVIAGSDPVLAGAMRRLDPAPSLQTLQSRVQVTKVASADILLISAHGPTAAQAEGTANAVANSYVAYVNPQAHLLDPAAAATGTPLSHWLLVTGGLGALLGALIGAICVLARGLGDRRFQMK